MKKIYLFLLLFFSVQIYAQLTNGSVAPNFTVTDINGTSHTLSSYLNAGKTVILKFSSVMCGVDWKYDQTEAAQDFYNSYGAPGSDEIVVLDVFNSTYDTLAELNGVSNPPTFGNWLIDKPFPMVLDPLIHSQYNANYTPLIYRICPSGILHNVGQASALSLYLGVSSACGALTGVENHARVVSDENGFCGTTGAFSAKLKNYGSNIINTAVIQLKQNGVVVSTKTITGPIAKLATQNFQFNDININPSAAYTAEVVSINGVANHNPAFSTVTLPFNMANNSGINLVIKLHTYVCPNNMSWNIKNSAGTIVGSGGPYEGGTGGICGGPYSNSIIVENLILPNSGDCYTLNLMDSNGLGWKNYEANSPQFGPGIEVFSGNNIVYSNLTVGNFGSLLTIKNFLRVSTLGIENPEDDNRLTIFPIPSSGIIHLTNDNMAEITVFDMLGKNVFNKKALNSNAVIDLTNLNNGIYIAKIQESGHEPILQKIILSH